MADIAPFDQAKDLARQINSVLSHVDIDVLTHEERELVITIKRLLEHVRLGARDYDYADTRKEQRRNAAETIQYLEELQADILKASEHDLFGAVDIAHASARIQQIISDMQ